VFGLFITFLAEVSLLVMNSFIFYNYIVFVHMDARISDIYLRISGLGRGYYIPSDNEISWNYLKQTYHIGEINQNRILVNEIKTPDPFTTSKPLSSKVYQFQRFSKFKIIQTLIYYYVNLFHFLAKGKAVETDDVYWATEKGQILDIGFHQMGTFRKTTLYGLLTNKECKV